MNAKCFMASVLFAGLFLCGPRSITAQLEHGSGFADSLELAGSEGINAIVDHSGASLYLSGTLTINEGHWSDAESIFTKVIDLHDDHSDGAHY